MVQRPARTRKGGERAFTDQLAQFFAGDPARVLVGIGDDAAVVRAGGPRMVVKIDPVVAGVHFEAGAPMALVGRKAVNRCLSDLAAMGAVPDYLLDCVTLPRRFPPRARAELFAGIRAAAAAARCLVVGGHVGVAAGPLTVAVAAIGHVETRPLIRAAARAGDWVHVTGPLGGSRLGKHLRFTPRLAEGRWLARQRRVHACIDISDGLLLDLWTVLEASAAKPRPGARAGSGSRSKPGLGAELFAEAIPVDRAAHRAARRSGRTALEHALGDGEDYELLFTTSGQPLARGGPLRPEARAPIGRVVAERGLWLALPGGRRVALRPEGFEHDL